MPKIYVCRLDVISIAQHLFASKPFFGGRTRFTENVLIVNTRITFNAFPIGLFAHIWSNGVCGVSARRNTDSDDVFLICCRRNRMSITMSVLQPSTPTCCPHIATHSIHKNHQHSKFIQNQINYIQNPNFPAHFRLVLKELMSTIKKAMRAFLFETKNTLYQSVYKKVVL